MSANLTFQSGLRLVCEPDDRTELAYLAAAIGSGSAYERKRESGLAHLVEHMIFRGAGELGPAELRQRLTDLGSLNTAATNYDRTVLTIACLPDQLPAAAATLADMLTRPRFAELDDERQIVLEELHSTWEGAPVKIVALCGGQGWARRPIIGRPETLGTFTRADLRRWHDAHYQPQNMAVCAAGAIDPGHVTELLKDAFAPGSAASSPRKINWGHAAPRLAYYSNEHFDRVIGRVLIEMPSRWQLEAEQRILELMLRSALHERVREQYGLVYEIDTQMLRFRNRQAVVIAFDTHLDNAPKTVKQIRKTLQALSLNQSVQATRAAARECLMVSLSYPEHPSDRAGELAFRALLGSTESNHIPGRDRLERVQPESVNALATELLRPERCALALRPVPRRALKRIVRAFNPALLDGEIIRLR